MMKYASTEQGMAIFDSVTFQNRTALGSNKEGWMVKEGTQRSIFI